MSISTGGVEMGQGLNTKVAQAVAKELNIPLELIIVKPSDSFVQPNNAPTGGSMASELCVHVSSTSIFNMGPPQPFICGSIL